MIALANFEFSAFNKKRIGYKDTSSSKLSKKLQKTAVFIENSGFGRSAETRTLDLLLPKQARYQLRNTPKTQFFSPSNVIWTLDQE